MENIEQLKQENAKLTERLNNAAKFFREQKAQIESLTKENEQLKNDNNVKDDSIRLNNELLETVEKLNKENEELKNQINSLEFNEESDANVISNYSKEIEELKSTIDSKDKAHKVLQDTYNEVYAENTKLKEDLENRIKQIRATEKTYDEEQKKIIVARDEWMKKYNTLKPQYDEVFNTSKGLGEQNNRLIKDCEKLTSDIAKVESDNDLLRKNIEGKDKLIEEQKNEISNLNVTLDDIENSKLAIECDFNNLEEKLNQMELNMVNKDEIIKSYEEELNNENICRYNKSDINELCDKILDFFKDKQLSINK